MKVRIRDNSLRLRLMQNEVKLLDQNKTIEARIQFGSNQSITYQLHLSDEHDVIHAQFIDNCLSVSIPTAMGQHWTNSNDVGLSHQQALPDGNSLSILIEKDFQCLTDRPGEDESDAFPNPNTSC